MGSARPHFCSFIITFIAEDRFAVPKSVCRLSVTHFQTLCSGVCCALWRWVKHAHTTGASLGSCQLCPVQIEASPDGALSSCVQRLSLHPISPCPLCHKHTYTHYPYPVSVSSLMHGLCHPKICPLTQYTDHLSSLYFKLCVLSHPLS